MDDRISESETLLQSRSSPFHILGRGIVVFLKAALGFEQDVMKEASARLADAESVTSAAQAKAVSAANSATNSDRSATTGDGAVNADGKAWRSEIYDAGTEYAICHAQAQTMAAVVGVLNESLTESMRGFWKLRKAWGVLEGIVAMESRFVERRKAEDGVSRSVTEKSQGEASSLVDAESEKVGKEDSVEKKEGKWEEESDDESAEFVDVGETLNNEGANDEAKKEAESKKQQEPPRPEQADVRTSATADPQPDALAPYLTHPMDHFIHTTVCTQYGLLLLLASMIPPAFSPILNIIGFRGDRTRGLSLLWLSSQSDSIQGAIAAIVVLEWYNGLVSFLDIQQLDAWPKQKLVELLVIMRQRYPNSTLWWKEEARMCSAERDLETSVNMLGPGYGPLGESEDDGHTQTVNGPVSKEKQSSEMNGSIEEDVKHTKTEKSEPKRKASLKQVEAIKYFERSLDAMYLHAYPIVSTSFQRCIGLNDWSHGLYYFIAGAAELELYRIYKYGGNILVPATPPEGEVTRTNPAPPATYETVQPNAEKAETHKAAATELFEKSLPAANKKRMLAKQLPFDVLIMRKINKWTAVAKKHNIDLADAVGVSPMEEMQLFWAGHGRMRLETMMECLRRLAFSDGDYSLVAKEEHQTTNRPVDPRKDELGDDDKATLALLRGVVLRKLGRIVSEGYRLEYMAKSRKMLKSNLIDKYEWKSFKAKVGKLGDTWPLPIARYELASCLWGEWLIAEAADHPIPFDAEGNMLGGNKFKECARLLEEVSKWESYDLDVRMGIKISTGRGTLRRMGVKIGA